MAKPTGFMEFEREAAPARRPEERVLDWDEYYSWPGDERLRR